MFGSTAWVKGVGHYDRVLFRVAADLRAGHYARATRDVNRLTRAVKTVTGLTRKLLARFKAVTCPVRPDLAGC